jgi:hypothetical protein
MKVNEFKKVEEGFFSDLARVGSDAVDTAKSSSEYQKKEQERFKNKVNIETQKRYLQDFIEDLIVDLDATIKSGGVDINAAAPKPQAQAPKPPGSEYAPPNSSGTQYDPKTTSTISEYATYNSLVESYISEQAAESISQYIVRWFAAYMKGVDWESDKANVETIAKEIESSYSKDRGKAAISKLANSSWNLIKDVSTTPYGAKDVISPNTPSNNSKVSDKELAKRIKDDTEKLKKTDPNLYDKIKNSLPESKIIKKKTS